MVGPSGMRLPGLLGLGKPEAVGSREEERCLWELSAWVLSPVTLGGKGRVRSGALLCASAHFFGIVTEVEETARGNLQGLSILETGCSV